MAPKKGKAAGADPNQSRIPQFQQQSGGSALAQKHGRAYELRDITGFTYIELSKRDEAIKAKDAAALAKKAAAELKATKEHNLAVVENRRRSCLEGIKALKEAIAIPSVREAVKAMDDELSKWQLPDYERCCES